MSTLTVDTLTNQDVQLAKAWVNFNGTGTVAIRSSFNVSSITDNGVGDYAANFTNNMADVNYAVSGSGGDGTGSARFLLLGATKSVSLVTVRGYSSAIVDLAEMNISIHGN